MTLDFLLKAFRKAFQKSAAQNQIDPNKDKSNDVANESFPSSKETLEEDFVDPFNPFPDPVIMEFRNVLDLHSIPPKQIRAVVEDYLEEAHRRRFPYLRIIHGKGIGVQREIIRSILANKSFVLEYKDAPMEAGGWGATIVTLDIKKG